MTNPELSLLIPYHRLTVEFPWTLQVLPLDLPSLENGNEVGCRDSMSQNEASRFEGVSVICITRYEHVGILCSRSNSPSLPLNKNTVPTRRARTCTFELAEVHPFAIY